jgi:FKBP-type peptidyl-prolyl cis-trans isomerase FkpA
MKIFISAILLLAGIASSSQIKEAPFIIPDSLKAAGVFTELSISSIHPKKENKAGIKADDVYLFLEAEKNEREIAMEFPENAVVVAKGIDVEAGKDELEWNYNWQLNEPYRLMIATATDSAANFILYSGFIYFPKDNKWKLIGTVKQTGKWGSVKTASSVTISNKKFTHSQTQAWLMRSNGSWKNLSNTTTTAPVINPMSNIDSIAQAAIDDYSIIKQLILEHKTDAATLQEGVYYTILKEGTGKQVLISDTVTVFYKGSLLSDGSVFDQTKEKPATFPLNRLINGWQIAVPLTKVGGKIKIIIPSGLAYSIRTRAAKIPPNSILVFEVEVVSVK